MPKEVEAHLPDGRVVTVQGVPDDLSPDDFKTQFKQRHPEYFGSTPAPSGETLPTRQLESGYSSPGLAALFGKGQPQSKPTSAPTDNQPGFWKSFGRQAEGLLEAPFSALGAPVMSPPQAASIANTAMTALSQSNNPISPETGLPLVDPTGMLKGLHTAAALTAPVGGGSLETGLEQLESGQLRSAAGTAAGASLPFAMAEGPEALRTGKEVFSEGLAATSHDILNRSANQLKAKLWDAHGKVGERVGQLKNDIAAADYQAGDASIPVADLWGKVQDIADRYKATGKDTPKFAAAADAVSQRGPYLTWKELDDLKQEIDPLWRKSAEGSRDSGATNELRDAINKKLSDRANELDRGQQFKAYNQLWSTLKKYEGEGALGKILTAENGASVMDVLKDSANKAELARTVDSLSKFGLPKDTLSNFADTHAPLHDYIKASEKRGIGKLKILAQRPIAGGIGVGVGTALGSVIGHPELGGIAGGIAGAGLADRVAAARAVSKLGKPSLEGEMADVANVKPVGTGERPTAPPPKPGAVNRDDLMSAMKGLGYSKQEAASRALQGMTDFPNDFSKALNRAMQGRPKMQEIKPVSGGSTPQMPESLPGGHAGGRVASIEELQRRGKNYVISKDNKVTYHGKSFAPEGTPEGGTHVTVLPDGTFQVNAGELTKAQQIALIKATKK